jgi:hypothetical protein
MKPNGLNFDKVKEHRGQYIVEYQTPNTGTRFAVLYLVFLNPIDKKKVVELMESELNLWLTKYAVPIMVSAFDEKGDLIRMTQIKGSDHLFGFVENGAEVSQRIWKLVKDEELPADALDMNYLRRVYADIPFKTGEQIQWDNKNRYKSIRVGWFIFFV